MKGTPMPLKPEPSRFALWALLFLFILRVVGQALVALGLAPFLPSMQAWQSGLLPYPALLASQIVLIALCVKILTARPNPRLGRVLLNFGFIYLALMVLRAILFGFGIPVFFHWVLALFLILAGARHRKAINGNALK